MSAAAEIASVTSELDNLGNGPIQRSELGTIDNAYKSIARVDRNELDFFNLPITIRT